MLHTSTLVLFSILSVSSAIHPAERHAYGSLPSHMQRPSAYGPPVYDNAMLADYPTKGRSPGYSRGGFGGRSTSYGRNFPSRKRSPSSNGYGSRSRSYRGRRPSRSSSFGRYGRSMSSRRGNSARSCSSDRGRSSSRGRYHLSSSRGRSSSYGRSSSRGYGRSMRSRSGGYGRPGVHGKSSSRGRFGHRGKRQGHGRRNRKHWSRSRSSSASSSSGSSRSRSRRSRSRPSRRHRQKVIGVSCSCNGPSKPTGAAPVTDNAYPMVPSGGDASPCTKEGEMKCDGQGFLTCANGKWTKQSCAQGAYCRPFNNSILCDKAENANAEKCSQEGENRCSATTSGYETCANGIWVVRPCNQGTKCQMAGPMPQCV